MNLSVVVVKVLHDAYLVAFRCRTSHGETRRVVGERSVFGRTPVRGEAWALTGTEENHKKYGRQVRVTEASLVRPSGNLFVGVVSHSVLFPGIGAARAHAVWKEHGDETFTLLDAGDPASSRTFSVRISPACWWRVGRHWTRIPASSVGSPGAAFRRRSRAS